MNFHHCPSCGSEIKFKKQCRGQENEVEDFLSMQIEEFQEDSNTPLKLIQDIKSELNCNHDLNPYLQEAHKILLTCSNPECKSVNKDRPQDYLKKIIYGKDLYDCQAVHAEENAILNSARFGGISLDGATLYTTTQPCLLCAKKIIASHIKEVVYLEPYADDRVEKHFVQSNIKMTQFQGFSPYRLFKLFKAYFL